jgi:hypothetical protein
LTIYSLVALNELMTSKGSGDVREMPLECIDFEINDTPVTKVFATALIE